MKEKEDQEEVQTDYVYEKPKLFVNKKESIKLILTFILYGFLFLILLLIAYLIQLI